MSGCIYDTNTNVAHYNALGGGSHENFALICKTDALGRTGTVRSPQTISRRLSLAISCHFPPNNRSVRYHHFSACFFLSHLIYPA
jgi:hypothetical protein